MSHFSDKNSVYPGRNGKTKPESLSLDIVDKLNLCLGVIKLQWAGPYFLSMWTFTLWSSLNGEVLYILNLTSGQMFLLHPARLAYNKSFKLLHACSQEETQHSFSQFSQHTVNKYNLYGTKCGPNMPLKEQCSVSFNLKKNKKNIHRNVLFSLIKI